MGAEQSPKRHRTRVEHQLRRESFEAARTRSSPEEQAKVDQFTGRMLGRLRKAKGGNITAQDLVQAIAHLLAKEL